MPVTRIRIKAASTGADRAAEPQRRGSKPGVARGSYKPRALKRPELTAEELEARCRDYWGSLYDEGVLVHHHRTRKLVSVRRYLPPESLHSPDHPAHDPLPPDGWKTCRGCRAELELSEFGPNGRGGFKARCKDCIAEAARACSRTPEGKAARARARQKYEAKVKAEESRRAARERFAAVCRKTEAGRALLAACEANSTPPKPATES